MSLAEAFLLSLVKVVALRQVHISDAEVIDRYIIIMACFLVGV